MNEKLKELAEQAGMEWDTHIWCWLANPPHLEKFADLVRQDERDKCAQEELIRADERDKCAQDYLQDCCDAIEAARLEEREACAKLCTEMGRQSSSDHEAGGMYWCAEAIRARGEQALDKKADNARDLGMNYELDAVQPKE
jgi:hypothetical protein